MKLNNAVVYLRGDGEVTTEQDDELVNVSYVLGLTTPKERPSILEKLFARARDMIHILHGIESGYDFCCIRAFIEGKEYYLSGKDDENGHALCEKCFCEEHKDVRHHLKIGLEVK